jgi:hypothetical protein
VREGSLCHDIAEILVKVALNTKNQINAECLVEKQPDYTIQASFCFYSLKLNAYQRSSILQFYSLWFFIGFGLTLQESNS